MDMPREKKGPFSFLLLRKRVERAGLMLRAPIHQVQAFHTALQGYEGLNVDNLPRLLSGYCHIPTSVLTQAFELWDLTESHKSELGINKSVVEKARGLNTTALFWQRMRTLCPKPSSMQDRFTKGMEKCVRQIKIWTKSC